MRTNTYRHLVVWQRAMELVDALYRLADDWPRDELFALTSQARRAVVSIPANIAEGQGRSGVRESLHHLSIAHGSLCEVETLLLIAQRRGYGDGPTTERVLAQADEVSRLIQGTMRGLRKQLEPTD